MIYKIQGSIHFRSDDGLMWLDDDSHITLTATTSRLLKYLLDHREEVVYRDEILEKVWDAYGLRTSSHSLNKYISDLRAALRNMGCLEEVIITIPKTGFRISEAIVIGIEGSSAGAVSGKNSAEEQELSCNCTAAQTTHKFTRGAVQKAAYALVALSALWLLWLNLKTPVYNHFFPADQEEAHSLGTIGSCQVKGFNAIPVDQKQRMMALAQQFIEKQGMHCSGSGVFYFNVSESVLRGHEGRGFVAYCRYSDVDKNHFNSCENYYRPDYEITN